MNGTENRNLPPHKSDRLKNIDEKQMRQIVSLLELFKETVQVVFLD
jgi:hypothetical protein